VTLCGGSSGTKALKGKRKEHMANSSSETLRLGRFPSPNARKKQASFKMKKEQALLGSVALLRGSAPYPVL